jgi:polysaccharide biosynthesis transport protein
VPTGTLEAQRDSRARQYGAALDLQQQILGSRAPSAGYLTLQEALPELAEVEDGGFAAPRSRPARSGLAAIVGLLLGLGVVLVAERLDTRIRTRRSTEEAFGLPVIAEVPVADPGGRYRILTDSDPLSASAEAYRTVRAAVLLMAATPLGGNPRHVAHPAADDEPRVVLVTSPAPGDGKTTTVANLAAAFAETGRSVLVLGCDFRRPEIHKMFDVPDRPGLSDVLDSGGATTLRDVVRPTPVSGVFIAPSGGALKSLGLVSSAGTQLIHDARDLADLVIIDTAPILATNEASEMVADCDAVVIVSRVGRTRVDAAKRTRQLLDRLGSTVLGVVLIGAGEEAAGGYRGYYSSNTVAPVRRSPIALRRTVRSDEIIERIQPWHGAEPPDAPPDPTPLESAPTQPDLPFRS